MKFLLANFFNDFWSSFAPRLGSAEIIVAIVLAVIGLSIAVLARRIARAIKDENDIPGDSKVLLTLKTIALVFIVSSAIIFMVTA